MFAGKRVLSTGLVYIYNVTYAYVTLWLYLSMRMYRHENVAFDASLAHMYQGCLYIYPEPTLGLCDTDICAWTSERRRLVLSIYTE